MPLDGAQVMRSGLVIMGADRKPQHNVLAESLEVLDEDGVPLLVRVALGALPELKLLGRDDTLLDVDAEVSVSALF